MLHIQLTVLVATLVVSSVVQAQRAPVAFVPHNPRNLARCNYRPAESPIGWTDNGHALVFVHSAIYCMGGDTFTARCDESGVFALDVAEGSVRKVYGFDRSRTGRGIACKPWLDNASLGHPHQLLYGFGGGANRVNALDLETGVQTSLGPDCPYRVSNPRLSPDGEMIAISWLCDPARNDPILAIMKVDGSELRLLTADDRDAADEPSWNPDGRHVVYARRDGTGGPGYAYITVIDTHTSTRRTIATGESPEWSPTGEWIAYQQDTGRASLPVIALVRPDGTGDHVVFDARTGINRSGIVDGAPTGPFRWTPDGHALVFARIFDAGTLLYELDTDSGSVTQLTGVDGDAVGPPH
jgi:Tol biopolymer transport system component